MCIDGLLLLQYKTIIVFSLSDIRCSTKGVGGTAPDLSDVETLEDGVVVPLGKPKQRSDVKVFILHRH